MDLTSLETWLRIAGPIHQDARGGMTLVECRSAAQVRIASAFYCAVRYSRFLNDNRNMRPVLLFPSGPPGAALHSRTVDQIKAILETENADPLILHLVPYTCDIRQCTTNGAENLLAFLKSLPSGSICGLAAADTLRFSKLATPTPGSTVSDASLARPHLAALLIKIAPLVRRKRLAVYLFSEPGSLDRTVGEALGDSFQWIATQDNVADDEHNHAWFNRLFALYEANGWNAVKQSLDYSAEHDVELALHFSELYAREKSWAKAWVVVSHLEPNIFEHRIELIHHMANLAFAAGHEQRAAQILAGVDPSNLPAIPERLYNLSVLAYRVGVEKLRDEARDELRKRFPKHPFTQEVIFSALFDQRNFADAHQHAKTHKLILEGAHAKAFEFPRRYLKRFLTLARTKGMEAEAWVSCAEEAEFTGHPCRAAWFAAQVPEGHPSAKKMRLLRCRIIAKHYQPRRRFMQRELRSLMEYVARNPKDESRRHIEFFFKHGMEEPLSQVILIQLLMELNQEDVLGKTLRRERSLRKNRKTNGNSDEFADIERFMEIVTTTSPGSSLILGEGDLPLEARNLISSRLVYFLGEMVLSEDGKDNPDIGLTALYYLTICCREIGDPSTDVAVAQSLIDYYATCGMSQEARILGDEVLQQLPEIHPTHATWRRSHCWQALAEASARSSNNHSGALYLCFAALAHEGAGYDIELLRRRYRLLARVLRDFGVSPFAEYFAQAEERLLRKGSRNPDAMHRLDVFRLQLEAKRSLNRGTAEIIELIRKTERLLKVKLQSEFMVLLSLQVSLFRLLPLEARPADLLDLFRERTHRMKEPLRSLLWGAVNPDINRQEILAILGRLSDAEDRRDLAFQIQPALPALANALDKSVREGDADLFLSASTGFSQPALGAPTFTSPSFRGANHVRTTLNADMDRTAGETTNRFSFARIGDISAQKVQASLLEGETVAVVSGEHAATPSVVLITRSSVITPRVMDDWLSASFVRWRREYYSALSWEKPKDYLPGIDVISPPRRDIEEFFTGLGLLVPRDVTRVTIIPPSHQFGFTWNLARNGDRFLCETHRVAIAPSLSFFIDQSRASWGERGKRKAWIGSKASTDEALSLLRNVTDNCLLSHSFDICDSDAPDDFSECDIAFIGAHGGTGLANFFRSVGDRVNEFPPIEIARRLRGCGCVILAVCSGGRSDRQSGSEETLGLVTELLRFGVRCVVAPPWPIDVSVVQFWLPGFLNAMEAGQMAFDAIDGGNERLRSNIDHPCAWGQLHLYGDASFRLERKIRAEPMGSAEGRS